MTTRAVCGMKAYPTGRRRLGLDDVPDLAGLMGVMSLAESGPESGAAMRWGLSGQRTLGPVVLLELHGLLDGVVPGLTRRVGGAVV